MARTDSAAGRGGHGLELIGSHFDYVANVNTATPAGSGAQHLVRYAMSERLDHSELRTQRTGTHRMNYTNNGSLWRHIRYGAAPVRAAMNAIYWLTGGDGFRLGRLAPSPDSSPRPDTVKQVCWSYGTADRALVVNVPRISRYRKPA
ncbi:hypothetical protein [Streptomyces albipurpureus]|uniref:Uncharacterized protein n=1 Tax=Streptomyces albipurpureus TaxID=2897419 RepID=A0ABT0UJ41_9ACTN|nr:hypothetical protein [Streptomyces sp. CWNU-1]MCM2388262.1 hypothetical protein [Streptomyces sp. CWNU-1]